MKASVHQTGDSGSTPTPSLQLMHADARKRFDADPSKCYQRHIRELYGASESREQIRSLDGARVERVTTEEAKSIILKYEWLQSMASGTSACYGLKLGDELLGVSCFTRMAGKQARSICGAEHKDRAVSLARGACVPHAPKNAASYLIRNACRLAYQDFGWEIFFAYSDPDAGEIGTVYQAANWRYIG